MTPERRWATVGAHRMSYQIAGPDDGEPIVLLHGLASDSDTWEYAVPALAARGLRVIAVDLLGHGESDKPETGYLLDDYAAQLNAFFAALELESATICGHSLGGAIAVHFGYHYPSRVTRLILVSSGGLGREVHFGLRAGALPGAPVVLGWVMSAAMLRFYGRPELHRALRLKPEQKVNLRRVGRALATAEGRTAFFKSLRGVIELGGQRGSFLEMRYLAEHLPTLVVWSEKDSVIPVRHARETHAHLPGSELVVFPGGGHEPHRRHAEDFAEAVHKFVSLT